MRNLAMCLEPAGILNSSLRSRGWGPPNLSPNISDFAVSTAENQVFNGFGACTALTVPRVGEADGSEVSLKPNRPRAGSDDYSCHEF